jgi:hypothetical protein
VASSSTLLLDFFAETAAPCYAPAMRWRVLTLVFCLGCMHAWTQSVPPADGEPKIVDLPATTRLKLLTPREAIHAEDEPDPEASTLTPLQRVLRARNTIRNNGMNVELEVVIDEGGRVLSAHATSGPIRFYAQAEEIERHRAYEPIRIDGNVVRVRAKDYVSLYPPEAWLPTPVPFPAVKDVRTVTLSLERTSCFGSCPSYTVSVSGTGEITFTSGDTNVAVPGTHHATIAPEAVRALLDQFRKADFFSARDEYECGWTDLSTQKLTISIGNRQKKVVDYGGAIVGLPDRVAALEEAIDKAVGVERWTVGNAATLPALLAEHWNFASASQENINLYDSAIRHVNHALVGQFVAAHAPVGTDDPTLLSPICVASGMNWQDLVKEQLGTSPRQYKPSPAVLRECLSAAALSGNLALLDRWLDLGARPLPSPEPEESTTYAKFPPPLLNAIRSGNLDVLSRLLDAKPDLPPAANYGQSLLVAVMQRGDTVQGDQMLRALTMLLQAGANPNGAGENDEIPLFEAIYSPSAIPVLVQAGADPNVRSKDGQTPLMRNAFVSEAVRQLLAAGADPTLKDNQGKTALDHVQNFQCPECVKLLQAAVAAKLQTPAAP